MEIRKATKEDLPGVHELLNQVLAIHAKIRPDIFIPNTRKYTDEELLKIFENPKTPVFVAVEDGKVLGHSFTILKEPPFSNNMIYHKTLFIDDLCVDQNTRGKKVGQKLYDYVIQFAKDEGCYNVTLNVWEGNDSARGFYEAMGFGIQETVMEKIL